MSFATIPVQSLEPALLLVQVALDAMDDVVIDLFFAPQLQQLK